MRLALGLHSLAAAKMNTLERLGFPLSTVHGDYSLRGNPPSLAVSMCTINTVSTTESELRQFSVANCSVLVMKVAEI